MNNLTNNRYAASLIVVAVAIIVWGIAGFIDRPGFGWGGYVYSPDYIVEGVEPGGAADKAGLEDGDRVISVQGIAVEDLPLYSRWPRSLAPGPGQSLRILVERNGERVSIDVVYAARNLNMLALGAAVIGLSFMIFGLWAFFTVHTSHALSLAHIGLAAAMATMGSMGPYLGTREGVASHIGAASMVLWSMLMLRFFLAFPKMKQPEKSRRFIRIIYGLWILFIACLVLELITHPIMYHTFDALGFLLILVYCILALVALTHSTVKMSPQERRNSGTIVIITGILVAFIPTLVGALAFVLRLNLPGSNYFPLMLAVFPLSMALAVKKHVRLFYNNLNP